MPLLFLNNPALFENTRSLLIDFYPLQQFLFIFFFK